MHDSRAFLAVLVLAAAATACGRAQAAGLETLLMPGKVVAGHAEFEQDCTQCHDRANRDRQSTLCMDCHEHVGADVRGRRGFHGRLAAIDRAQCTACHSEHLGRDADIVKLSRPAFDHSRTDFSLTGAHAASACDGCHEPGSKHRDAPSSCLDCHRADEPHAGRLGTDCAGCHETATWSQGRFDHGKTRFALLEGHAEVTCSACHGGNRYAGTPTQCAACHAPDDVHRGGRGPECGSCHGIAGWKTTRFDHARETGYALTGAHAPLDCKTCHTTANMTDPLPSDCVGCHRKADSHASRFGEGCEKCHGTGAWQPATFDHVRDGHYELLGRHAKLGCHACHSGVVAQQKLGTECNACHRSQDAHAGQLGQDCQRCHGVEQWRSGVAFDHELVDFPLVGLHVAVPCHECHATPTYRGAAQECQGCHQHEDKHKGALGKDCESCHSPSGWGLWEFDHAKSTGFGLSGAHARATCDGCHERPAAEVRLSGDCASCHAHDDVHHGQFGRQCQRCHGSVTFKGARMQ